MPIKVPTVVGLGLLSWQSLLADLIFMPAVVLGAFVGIAVFRRMNQRVFTDVARSISGVAGIWLIIHG